MDIIPFDDATRIERARKNGYTHMLHFTREHNDKRSCLFGMRGDDLLPFCLHRSALQWVAAINASRPGRVGYRVVAFNVQRLRPS